MIKDQGQASTDDINPGTEFMISDTEVAAFIEDNAAEQVTNINATTRQAIHDYLVEANRENLTVQEIARGLDELFVFGQSRSLRIARTETVRSYNAATDFSFKQNDELVEGKEWLTAGDEKVRDSHAALDGVVVALGDQFDNGCEYPGDPAGAPEETINCRCTIAAKTADGKRVRLRGDLESLLAPTTYRNGTAPRVTFAEVATR